MSQDYSKYIFELGENPVRTYKGQRMRPLDGCAIGLKVWKIVLEVLGGISFSEDERTQEERMFQILSKAFEKVDTSIFMGLMKSIATAPGVLIFASVEGDTKTYTLDNEKRINDWFSKYPEDLLKFAVQIIWETSSPFLPKEVKEAIGKMGIDIQKIG